MNKIVVEQLLNGLPNDLKVFVASHNPETPTVVADLIETYDSAHGRGAHSRERSRYQDRLEHRRFKHSSKESGGSRKVNSSAPKERKPMAEITCYKCHKKGHFARSCTETTYRVREEAETANFIGEVNGRAVKRILIDSGASRTIVNKELVAPADIRKGEFITVSLEMELPENIHWHRCR